MLAETKIIRESSFGINIDVCHYEMLKNVLDNGIEETLEKTIVDIIDCLHCVNDRRFVEVLMHLVTFKREVKWYNDSRYFIGWKEIGAPIRLAAVKALGNIGDTKALCVLYGALKDVGDRNNENGEPRWHVYRNGDDIRKEAQLSIKKLQMNLIRKGISNNLCNVN